MKGRPKKILSGPVVKTTAKIPEHLWKAVKKRCVDQEIDLADAINDGLEMWMSKSAELKAKHHSSL